MPEIPPGLLVEVYAALDAARIATIPHPPEAVLIETTELNKIGRSDLANELAVNAEVRVDENESGG